MKIATAAYPLDVLSSWAQYEDKLAGWVGDAAGQGADLLVFPEYGAMELATLAGPEIAGDLEQSLYAVSDRLADADALHVRLAAEHGVHIVAASGPAATETRPVNRARLITPTGQIGVQDKQIMTRFEAEEWDVIPGNGLQVFDTALGKIGILICYDSEFPLLGRALTDCDIICVPSVTETLAGYWRVRIGAMARALENQCYHRDVLGRGGRGLVLCDGHVIRCRWPIRAAGPGVAAHRRSGRRRDQRAGMDLCGRRSGPDRRGAARRHRPEPPRLAGAGGPRRASAIRALALNSP